MGQRFGRHIDESVYLENGLRTYYTLLIYLSGRGGNKDASSDSLVGGETVFYDQGRVVAEVTINVICFLFYNGQVHYIYSVHLEVFCHLTMF